MKKDINPEDYEVGAIVGRFQISELHEAHEHLIDTVCSHKKVIILLGVTQAIGTPEDPIRLPSKENVLDYSSRRYMIQEKYPNAIIVPIQDKPDDKQWSESVDDKIREIFPTESVLLYGGRDSFAPYYHGTFDIKYLDPDIYVSATMVRNSVSKEVLKSEDFRKGQIYQAYQQTPILYTKYKIAVKQDNKLLFRQNHKRNNIDYPYSLLEGLAGINDSSLEVGTKRVIGNLIGNVEVDVSYEISKTNIEYGNKTNRVLNVLMLAELKFGHISPNGNFDLKWISIDELLSDGYMVKHIDKKEWENIQHLISKYRKRSFDL